MAQIKKQDTYTASDKKTELYSDFLTNLTPHPTTEDLVRSVNENAVKRSIRNLVNTDRGERLFQPDKGSRIRAMLFELMSADTAQMIKDEIFDTLTQYEPRARVHEVIVTPDDINNAYVCTVIFSVINIERPLEYSFTLSRVR